MTSYGATQTQWFVQKDTSEHKLMFYSKLNFLNLEIPYA